MAKSLVHFVLRGPNGELVSFRPGQAIPAWAEAEITNPAVTGKGAPAEAEAVEADLPGEFNPSDHKVGEVLAYLAEASDEERERVFEAEAAAGARKTIMELTVADTESDDEEDDDLLG